VGKWQFKERSGLEPQANFYPFKKMPKAECGLDFRIYSKFQSLDGGLKKASRLK
jgi:hypothetical protein